MAFFDAHCHLQDRRILDTADEVFDLYSKLGVREAVVNGTCQDDWPEVAKFSDRYEKAKPSFGVHPWKVKEIGEGWEKDLLHYLNTYPNAAIGEIGLDRWIEGHDLEEQEPIFIRQLEIASERNLPVSIHCLQAWGRMMELLRSKSLPERGFMLHSYGGSAEMIKPFADLGAYFSVSGYFALDRNGKKRDALKSVPIDRLLIETDAPDMAGPKSTRPYEIANNPDLNHPVNIVAVYEFVAELFDIDLEDLAKRVALNYKRFFDGWLFRSSQISGKREK